MTFIIIQIMYILQCLFRTHWILAMIYNQRHKNCFKSSHNLIMLHCGQYYLFGMFIGSIKTKRKSESLSRLLNIIHSLPFVCWIPRFPLLSARYSTGSTFCLDESLPKKLSTMMINDEVQQTLVEKSNSKSELFSFRTGSILTFPQSQPVREHIKTFFCSSFLFLFHFFSFPWEKILRLLHLPLFIQ